MRGGARVVAVVVLGLLGLVAGAAVAAQPAVGPGPLPGEDIQLTFDGKPGPFAPTRVGQTVRVEAWFLGRPLPLDRCDVAFPGGWAKLDVHSSGKYGTLTVVRMDQSSRELSDEEFTYGIRVAIKMQTQATTRLPATLTLDAPFRFHRLDATIKLPSGTVKPFDLRSHPDIQPVRPEDVYAWPSETEVILWKNALWVGFTTQEIEWADGVPRGIEPAGVVLVAVRIRLKTGGERWIYTNFIPTSLRHRGWDDQVSALRLPVFPGSEKVYRDATTFFRARGVPFGSLDDTSRVRGEKTGR